MKKGYFIIFSKPPSKTLCNFILFGVCLYIFYSYHPLIKTQTHFCFLFFVVVWLLFLMMVVLVVIWITLLVCCFLLSLSGVWEMCVSVWKCFLSIINEEELTIGSSSQVRTAKANSRSTATAQWHKGVGIFSAKDDTMRKKRGNKFLSAGN